ncbi:unnamed protein product [Trichogramma brassicae]|uniref:Uncharacterized protein n=1 Tax=Trichogramma brassicae TaxID=86971 RepID=A0A6H5IU10_9HYME|nr:unnamed protein product [Trichogramma brassicae]
MKENTEAEIERLIQKATSNRASLSYYFVNQSTQRATTVRAAQFRATTPRTTTPRAAASFGHRRRGLGSSRRFGSGRSLATPSTATKFPTGQSWYHWFWSASGPPCSSALTNLLVRQASHLVRASRGAVLSRQHHHGADEVLPCHLTNRCPCSRRSRGHHNQPTCQSAVNASTAAVDRSTVIIGRVARPSSTARRRARRSAESGFTKQVKTASTYAIEHINRSLGSASIALDAKTRSIVLIHFISDRVKPRVPPIRTRTRANQVHQQICALRRRSSAQLKLVNHIANFYENSTAKVKKEAQPLEHFKCRLELLENYWDKFMDRHDELIPFEQELKAEKYFAEDYYTLIELKYAKVKAAIKQIIASFPENQQQQLPREAGRGTGIFDQSAALPKLSLPTFSGQQDEWESFKQRFCSLVRDNQAIPKVAKLQHLLNAVKGPAAMRLKGIEITDANFDVAWDKLARRYDNRRIRLFNALEHIIQLPTVKTRTAEGLTDLINRSEEAVRSLRELQCPVDHYDHWIVHCVVRKLDTNSRETWEISREESAAIPTYNDLLSFLERRIQSLEQIAESSDSRAVPVCDLCQAGHWLHRCHKFIAMTQQQRFDVCKNKRLCLNCLHRSHVVDRCPSQSRCLVCKGKHHTKLHTDGNRNTRSRGSSNAEERHDDGSDSASSDREPCTVNAHATTTDAEVLLATAMILVVAADGRALPVRALIDPCSERTFITWRVAQQLNLKIARIQPLNVVGLGATTSSRAHSEIHCRVKSARQADFAMDLQMLVMTDLTQYLPQNKLSLEVWPHVRSLRLADPRFGQPAKVDCVLGADVYSTIILNGLVKGPVGTPVAQDTVFGWILTGRALPDGTIFDNLATKIFHTCTEPAISAQVAKLWELDNIDSVTHLSEEDKRCEEQFQRTHT